MSAFGLHLIGLGRFSDVQHGSATTFSKIQQRSATRLGSHFSDVQQDSTTFSNVQQLCFIFSNVQQSYSVIFSSVQLGSERFRKVQQGLAIRLGSAQQDSLVVFNEFYQLEIHITTYSNIQQCSHMLVS